MRRDGRALIGFVVALGSLLIPLLGVPVVMASHDSDPVDRAATDVSRMLFRFEQTGRPEELRRWLADYHGEAPDTEAMIMLARWSKQHPREFLALAEGYRGQQRRTFIERFRSGMGDSGLTWAELRKAFRSYRSPILDAIMK
jgi:hypothetical protein